MSEYVRKCRPESDFRRRLARGRHFCSFLSENNPAGVHSGAFGAARVDFRCFLVAPEPHRQIMFFSTSPKIHKIDNEIEPVQMTR